MEDLTGFITDVKKTSAEARERKETEEREAKTNERETLLAKIKEEAAAGGHEIVMALAKHTKEEVEAMFNGLVTVEKIRGKKHRISW